MRDAVPYGLVSKTLDVCLTIRVSFFKVLHERLFALRSCAAEQARVVKRAVSSQENLSITSLLMFSPMVRHWLRFRLRLRIALAIVLPSAEGSITPNASLGISSCTPPTLVTRGVVLQAAASNREVENPSEREGRQNISDSLSRADISCVSRRPRNVTFASGSCVKISLRGPSPAIKK